MRMAARRTQKDKRITGPCWKRTLEKKRVQGLLKPREGGKGQTTAVYYKH